MTIRRKLTPPVPPNAAGTPAPRSLLELDRFSEASVHRWNEISADLDELNAVLQFNLEPERRRHRPELLAALAKETAFELDLSGWVRIVSFQYSHAPLSSAGSLNDVGGRFNAGLELEPNTITPWPALYMAQDFETAYREKFQRAVGEKVDGLTPEELSLGAGGSHSTVVLTGKLSKVFDLTRPDTLAGVATVLGRIKMPDRAEALKKRLKIPKNDLKMARTGKQIHDITVVQNWRILPMQFGLPAHSHILAELIKEAGFEAILYPSTKGGGHCIALFPEHLAPGSFVQLMDAAPDYVKYPRLDINTAEALAGWDVWGYGPSGRRPSKT